MPLRRRGLLSGSVATGLLGFRRGHAEAGNTIRIGVLTDMSGSLRDTTGPGSVAGAKLAAAEFTAANPGIAVEVLAADHQNKADVGTSIAREWFDRGGVDAITDIGNSAVALGCVAVTRQKDKVQLTTSAGTTELTGRSCSPNGIQWTFDSYSIAHTMGTLVTEIAGKTWFFVTPDYAGGKSAQEETARFVQAAGGKALGAVLYPFGSTSDFSSYLVQAQSSGAAVVAFANGGDEMINSVKQAREFGLERGGARLAVLAANALSIGREGVQTMQGVLMCETFYWDLNDRTRAFASRFKPLMPPGYFPNSLHAGNYGAVTHYLKAVKALGVERAKASGGEVVAMMKKLPTDDDCFGAGYVREDGRVIHPNYLFEVKTPAESRGPDDVLRVLATTPADQAFRPLSESACPDVRK
jgi:branched-chain amino acid transport system substrate-binding protein